MIRYELLKILAGMMKDELCIAAIGGMVEEWDNARTENRHANLFLLAMGCHTPLALGVAVGLPHRTVVCLDSDGGVLMNLGSLATLGNRQPENLKVFVFDNGVYESVGAPPTATSGRVDLAAMARGAGIAQARTVRAESEFMEAAKEALTTKGLRYTVVKTSPDVPTNLARKKTDGLEDKYNFVRYVEETEGIAILRPRVPHWMSHAEDAAYFMRPER
ncbi:MAG: thiamine pyrophosphate-binding protein [Candidatus Tectomicrobia bacterium]|nr:thiamine pyrophosphate-binding protein [Candidatus Tectomicrobia bacterium]